MNKQLFNRLQEKALQQRAETAFERIEKLERIEKWIQHNEQLILDALKKDFNKPHFETQISEILPTLSEIHFFKKNLKLWMKDRSVPTPIALFGHSSRIRYENKGVILIIAPWNYPFQLAIAPLVAAVAAGNTVVIKPSEMTEATSSIILKLVTACFSTDEIIVEQGGKEKTEELLCYDFNHVFFTGSTQVGRLIAKACAERLIPFTLELGGKSPTIVDETADLTIAAEKIFWGKFLNRGQTCIAPDYVLVHSKKAERLKHLLQNLNERHRHDDKALIINVNHRSRLTKLLEGSSDIETPALTLANEVASDSLSMQEEIFGPVLPVISYTDESEIFAWIAKNPTPLSLYIFSKRKSLIKKVLSLVRSGGVGINTVLMHFANHHLPFGGIGLSGMGRYHGHFGFLEFSHQRAVIEQKFLAKIHYFLQPPYTSFKSKVLQIIKQVST